MKKLLRPRDILLLGLTHALDAFEEIKDPFHLVSKSYENMYGWVPKQYEKHQFNHLVWRTLKAGYIEKVEKNGEIYIRITSQGGREIRRDFPLLSLQRKPWDGKWRIIMFDIEEKKKRKRDYLREKLRELGFGMLQESVFISPHDISKDFSEFIETIDLQNSVDILEAKFVLADSKKLAERIWKLEELSRKYLEILQDVQKIKNSHLTETSGRSEQLNNKTRRIGKIKEVGRVKEVVEIKELRIKEIKELKMKGLRELRMKYLDTLLRDPFLPSALLPKNYLRDRVGELIKELS